MNPYLKPEDFIGSRVGASRSLIIRRLLGRGAMSAVWLAHDEQNGRDVALKFLNDDLSTNAVALARFVREARRFGSVGHPHIVHVYSLGQEAGRLFLVLEYVEGLDLYATLQVRGALPVLEGLELARQIASGLAEAHRHQVVHRDLKPENIMVRAKDGQAKVLDFGIAKDLGSKTNLTRMGMYIGTPAYSAPEQIMGEPLDHRADIFSLGVILYELLTGKMAFEGRHSTEILQATLENTPLPADRINDEVTRPVALLIQRMIRKTPSKRLGSMDEVVERIEVIQGTLQGNAPNLSDVGTDLKRAFENP